MPLRCPKIALQMSSTICCPYFSRLMNIIQNNYERGGCRSPSHPTSSAYPLKGRLLTGKPLLLFPCHRLSRTFPTDRVCTPRHPRLRRSRSYKPDKRMKLLMLPCHSDIFRRLPWPYRHKSACTPPRHKRDCEMHEDMIGKKRPSIISRAVRREPTSRSRQWHTDFAIPIMWFAVPKACIFEVPISSL